MNLTEGFNFFKQKSGLKLNELTENDKNKLKIFREKWVDFTDAIAHGFELKDIKNGKGLWQNSGIVSSYIWNRYKPVNDDSNLVIFFTLSVDAGFFVSIGLVDDKLTTKEQDISSDIYKFLSEQQKGNACPGFDNSVVGNERRYFFNPDDINELNFDCVLNSLISTYHSAFNKFYVDSKDELMDNFFQNRQIGERFKNLYEQQTDKNKNIVRSIIELVHKKNYDWYFINISFPEKSLRFGVKKLEDRKARSAVRLYFKNGSIFLSVINSVVEQFFPSISLDKLKFYSKDTSHFMLELNDDTIKIIEEHLKDSKDGNGRFPKDYEVEESSYDENEDNKMGESIGIAEVCSKPLNTILFGPPGTGKTYNTINHALSILSSDSVPGKRSEAKKAFDDYVAKGQIVFTTFHQSYGYEEFIEGIKPDMESDDGEVRYEVKDGVFKELCNRALGVKTFKSGKDEIEIKSDATVWKVSLGSSGNNPIKTKCFDEGTIRIGWTSVKEVGDEYYIKLGSKNKNTIRNFIDEMKIGDIVVSIGNQKNADAIGVIVGDYETDNDPNYPKFRNVKWYFTGRNVSIYDLNERKNLVQQTVYKLHSISVEKVISLLKEQGVFNTPTSPEDYESKINYVIIIDEINRGNISKIFGELITLIEPSKRIGAPEELRVTLPYSGNEFDGGKGFGVPSNVYIIGTMNTADRNGHCFTSSF